MPILLLAGDGLLVAAGWGLSRLLPKPVTPLGPLVGVCLAFLYGAALHGILVMSLGVIGLPIAPFPIVAPALAALALTGLLRGRGPGASGLRSSVVLAPAVAVIAASAWRLASMVGRPRGYATDEYAIWVLKARVLFFSGTLDAAYFAKQRVYSLSHLDYPLLWPALLAWSDRWMGRTTSAGEGVQYILIVACATVVVAAAAARIAGPVSSVLSVVLVLSTASMGLAFPPYRIAGGLMADIPVACFAVAAFALVAIWVETVDDAWLAAAIPVLAGSMLTKNEGLILSFAVVVAAAAGARSFRALRRLALTWAIAFATYLPWLIWLRVKGIQDGVVNPSTARPSNVIGNLDRIDEIARFISQNWIGRGAPGIATVVTVLALAAFVGRWRLSLFIALATTFAIIGISFAYVVTPLDLTYHLRTSAPRVMIGPALFLAAGVAIAAGAALRSAWSTLPERRRAPWRQISDAPEEDVATMGA